MKNTLSRVLVITFLLSALTLVAVSPALAEEMTCATPTPVSIDIKPGSYPNSVNLNSQGVLPVAVLTTAGFDASQFVPQMVHLADANTPMSDICATATAVRWVYKDVNGDGRLDLLFFFNTQGLNFTASTTAAMLMGHGTYAGATTHIMGMDSVLIKP